MLDIERYYRVLDVEPGASPEEVHQGYLDLTWVWHPDRFAGNPRLQQKAHYKLQEINEAHAQLRSLTTPRKKEFRTKPASKVSPSPQPHPSTEGFYQPQATYKREAEDKTTVQECQPRSSANNRHIDAWLD
jgi:curved DNA-binding protein CbpA